MIRIKNRSQSSALDSLKRHPVFSIKNGFALVWSILCLISPTKHQIPNWGQQNMLKCTSILDEEKCYREKDCCFSKVKYRELNYHFCINKPETLKLLADYYFTNLDIGSVPMDWNSPYYRDLYICCQDTLIDSTQPTSPDKKLLESEVQKCLSTSHQSIDLLTKRYKCMIGLLIKRGENILPDPFIQCSAFVLSLSWIIMFLLGLIM